MSLKNCRAILVPVDFSGDSLEAVEQSLVLAGSLDADLLLLHVVHDLADAPGLYHKEKARDKAVRKMTETAREMMADFIAKLDLESRAKQAGTRLSVLVKRGLPTTRILQIAKREKVDLIAMGSRGRTGLAHLLLGSTAERVVHLAPIPVVVFKQRSNRQ
jgi:nucleotide-binding universal stress UspA family protein